MIAGVARGTVGGRGARGANVLGGGLSTPFDDPAAKVAGSLEPSPGWEEEVADGAAPRPPAPGWVEAGIGPPIDASEAGAAGEPPPQVAWDAEANIAGKRATAGSADRVVADEGSTRATTRRAPVGGSTPARVAADDRSREGSRREGDGHRGTPPNGANGGNGAAVPAGREPPVNGSAGSGSAGRATRGTSDEAADADVLVGSVIDQPSLFIEVSYVRTADFSSDFHQLAWAAIGSTVRSQGLVSVASIAAMDRRIDRDRLQACAAAAPRSPEACRTAAKRIADKRRAREVAAILAEAAQDIRRIADTPLLAMGDGDVVETENWGARLAAAHAECLALTASSHVLDASHVEARIRTREVTVDPPVATGIACLDTYLRGGLRPGHVMAIAAQTKVGKTVLATTISHNAELAGVRHLFATLERSSEDIEKLKLARRLGVRGFDLPAVEPARYGRLGPMERHCQYMHRPGASVEEVRSEILYQVKIMGARLAIVDYLQVMRSRNPKESPEAHMTRAAQLIQQTAVEARIPVIVTVQHNDMGYAPMSSSAMKNAANVYLVLQRDRGSERAYLETHASNLGDEVDIGSIGTPSLRLSAAGPHYVDASTPDAP